MSDHYGRDLPVAYAASGRGQRRGLQDAPIAGAPAAVSVPVGRVPAAASCPATGFTPSAPGLRAAPHTPPTPHCKLSSHKPCTSHFMNTCHMPCAIRCVEGFRASGPQHARGTIQKERCSGGLPQALASPVVRAHCMRTCLSTAHVIPTKPAVCVLPHSHDSAPQMGPMYKKKRRALSSTHLVRGALPTYSGPNPPPPQIKITRMSPLWDHHSTGQL